MTEILQPIPRAPSASGECIEHPMQLLTGWINPATERELVTLRRDIHREPEPGWAEFISTARLAKYFRRAGFEVRYGPEFIRDDLIRGRDMAETRRGIARAKAAGIDAETLERMGSIPGLLAVWDSGRPGKTVAIRVELDAVYVDEPKTAGHIPAEKGFASRRRGLMHACGHDAHQAAAAHLARFVHANAGQLDGKVMFLCQPAEEGSRGAYPIVQSGALDGVDVLLCAHVAVDITAGTVVAAPEKFLCTTKIDLEFTGTPSHAGMQPQLGRNALLAAANTAVNLMALPRHADGMTRVNVGSLHAGEGRNIVPSHAVMEVEVRGENEAINRDLAREALERASGMAAAFGVKLRPVAQPVHHAAHHGLRPPRALLPHDRARARREQLRRRHAPHAPRAGAGRARGLLHGGRRLPGPRRLGGGRLRRARRRDPLRHLREPHHRAPRALELTAPPGGPSL